MEVAMRTRDARQPWLAWPPLPHSNNMATNDVPCFTAQNTRNIWRVYFPRESLSFSVVSHGIVSDNDCSRKQAKWYLRRPLHHIFDTKEGALNATDLEYNLQRELFIETYLLLHTLTRLKPETRDKGRRMNPERIRVHCCFFRKRAATVLFPLLVGVVLYSHLISCLSYSLFCFPSVK